MEIFKKILSLIILVKGIVIESYLRLFGKELF